MVDLSILEELIQGNHLTRTTGKVLREFKFHGNIVTVKRRLVFLESEGFIERGFRIKKADTFFITENGIKFFKEASN